MGLLDAILGSRKAPRAPLEDLLERHLAAKAANHNPTLADLLVVAGLSTTLGVVQWRNGISAKATELGERPFEGVASDIMLFEANAWFFAEVMAFVDGNPKFVVGERQVLRTIVLTALEEVGTFAEQIFRNGRELLVNHVKAWPLEGHDGLEWFWAASIAARNCNAPVENPTIQNAVPQRSRILPLLEGEEFRAAKRQGPPFTLWDDLPWSLVVGLPFYYTQVHAPGVLRTSDMITEAVDRFGRNRGPP